MSTQTLRKEDSGHFIPESFQLNQWEDVKPFFDDLLFRPIQSLADLERLILDKSQLDAAISEAFAWLYINITLNSANKEAGRRYSYAAEHLTPKVSEFEQALNLRIVDSPFFEELPKEKYFIYHRKVRNAVSLFSATNLDLKSEVQLESKEFGRILSQMTIGVDGQQLTLQKAGILLEERDRDKRRQVYHKINQRILQNTEELEDLFDRLLEKRHQIALNAGFKNYRDYAFRNLERFDYSPEDCNVLHESIRVSILPILGKIYHHRKNLLELDLLRPYDLNIDIKGRIPLRPFRDIDDLLAKSVLCLNRIDPEFGQVIQKMHKMGHLDLESRKGKRPGGYNMPLHVTGVPFLFMNAANSINDLRTLMHESGHAVHAYLTKDLNIFSDRRFPSEISELAAMTMELLSMEHWDIFFDNEDDLKRAKIYQLANVIRVLPWIATIDKFQHWLYTNPGHSREERREVWLNTLKMFSPEVLDYSGLEKYLANLWLKQLHLFEVPFYYVEYAFAQLGAIAVWQNYHENPAKAIQDYIDTLKLGYTKSVCDTYASAGIRFDFKQNYVSGLGAFVDQKIDELYR